MEESQKLDFLSTLLPLSGIIFIIVLGVLFLNQQFNKNLYRQRLERERLKTKHQQDLLRSSIQVQEEERKRIARDLHDELGAALSMSRMHIVQLEEKNKYGTELLAPLQNIRAMTEAALASMRRISHELMPPQLETFGLLKTLETTAVQINKLPDLQMEISVSQNYIRMPSQVELGIYRVCMELINNTIKHAKASSILITMQQQNGLFKMEYRDNGIGFRDSSAGEGLGHRSIEARIDSLGGKFSMGNATQGGIFVIAEIPLPKLI
ncbi:MAG: sensor histidine kinase [Bacteroidota bacterium]|nr:sensor histidine kinase [Bacteroidota bacterium]